MNYKCNLCTTLCEAGKLRAIPCDPTILIDDKEYNDKETKTTDTKAHTLDLWYQTNPE